VIWSTVATLVTAKAMPASTAHAPSPLRVFISLPNYFQADTRVT
jgi:hypothetical protein